MSKEYAETPASRVMDEAIELAIAEESPFPEWSAFINADTQYTDREIREAATDGYSVVLVSADGDIQIISPNEIVAA